ncbi:MAG TPA: hypothetical protein P5307_25725 [Pirellulaceae bacterium]|nr:hypothetical protein [Planctomycetaceae bacterium]HRX82502.1 hypothetical protein [Pirellulaceae bacterium]
MFLLGSVFWYIQAGFKAELDELDPTRANTLDKPAFEFEIVVRAEAVAATGVELTVAWPSIGGTFASRLEREIEGEKILLRRTVCRV